MKINVLTLTLFLTGVQYQIHAQSPSDNHISSSTAEKANIYLTDASGQLIDKSVLYLQMRDNQQVIPISRLSKGQYNLFIETESQQQTVSLIKL